MSTPNNNLEFQGLLLSKRYDCGYIDNDYAFCATLCSSHCSEVITVILFKLLKMAVFKDVMCSLLEYCQCFGGADGLCL